MPSKALVPLTPAPPPAPAAAGVPWPPPKQDRESESAIVTIARWARRNRHVTVPLAIPPALWLAGLIFRQTHTARYVALGGIMLTAAVCYFAPHKWTGPDGKPRWPEVWYADLSAAAAAAWLTAAAIAGPAAAPVTAIVLASTLTAGGVTWGCFWWRHKRPRGMKLRQRLTAQCDAWWQSYCFGWNLRGSAVKDAEIKGVTLRIRVRGIPGTHTLNHFRQAIPFIESAAEGQADIGLVRVEPVKGIPCEVDIFLKRDNPLREPVEYDPGIAPRSVHDPAPAGRKETGEWKMTDLRVNRFTIGKTRWGKSNDLLVAAANLSGCPDALTVLIDLKGGRSARPVLQACAAAYVITERDEARMFLRMCAAEIKARAMYAYDGKEQLHATREVPAVVTMVDETYGLTATEDGAGDPECRRLAGVYASQGSGLAMYLYVYTQNGALETSVGTEQIRANLPHRTCYAVSEARHGAYVIPEYNRLDASRLEEKGTCYVKDGPDVTPEQVRAPHMPHDRFGGIVAAGADMSGPARPLVLYCGEDVAYTDGDRGVTWQEWWDARWLRLHPAFRAGSPQYQAAAAAHSPAAGPPPDTTPAPPPPAGDAPLLLPAGFRPDPAAVRALPRVMAAQRAAFCHHLETATAAAPVTPRDLAARSGMSRSWVFARMAGLAELGLVTQASRGLYYAVPGADIAAGLAEITGRADRTAAEARQIINAQ
jgi:hypothetical protein